MRWLSHPVNTWIWNLARHLDIPQGLLDSDAPVQALNELHKVNHYKVDLLWLFCLSHWCFRGFSQVPIFKRTPSSMGGSSHAKASAPPQPLNMAWHTHTDTWIAGSHQSVPGPLTGTDLMWA